MNAVKAYYHDGAVELLEQPGFITTGQVLVVFPDEHKGNAKLCGALQSYADVDFDAVEDELKALQNSSVKHIASEVEQ